MDNSETVKRIIDKALQAADNKNDFDLLEFVAKSHYYSANKLWIIQYLQEKGSAVAIAVFIGNIIKKDLLEVFTKDEKSKLIEQIMALTPGKRIGCLLRINENTDYLDEQIECLTNSDIDEALNICLSKTSPDLVFQFAQLLTKEDYKQIEAVSYLFERWNELGGAEDYPEGEDGKEAIKTIWDEAINRGDPRILYAIHQYFPLITTKEAAGYDPETLFKKILNEQTQITAKDVGKIRYIKQVFKEEYGKSVGVEYWGNQLLKYNKDADQQWIEAWVLIEKIKSARWADEPRTRIEAIFREYNVNLRRIKITPYKSIAWRMTEDITEAFCLLLRYSPVNIYRFLLLIESINPFSVNSELTIENGYERPIINILKTSDIIDYSLNREGITSIIAKCYSFNDLIRIYLNSPLKFIYNIFEIVQQLSAIFGVSEFKRTALDNVVIKGQIKRKNDNDWLKITGCGGIDYSVRCKYKEDTEKIKDSDFIRGTIGRYEDGKFILKNVTAHRSDKVLQQNPTPISDDVICNIIQEYENIARDAAYNRTTLYTLIKSEDKRIEIPKYEIKYESDLIAKAAIVITNAYIAIAKSGGNLESFIDKTRNGLTEIIDLFRDNPFGEDWTRVDKDLHNNLIENGIVRCFRTLEDSSISLEDAVLIYFNTVLKKICCLSDLIVILLTKQNKGLNSAASIRIDDISRQLDRIYAGKIITKDKITYSINPQTVYRYKDRYIIETPSQKMNKLFGKLWYFTIDSYIIHEHIFIVKECAIYSQIGEKMQWQLFRAAMNFWIDEKGNIGGMKWNIEKIINKPLDETIFSKEEYHEILNGYCRTVIEKQESLLEAIRFLGDNNYFKNMNRSSVKWDQIYQRNREQYENYIDLITKSNIYTISELAELYAFSPIRIVVPIEHILKILNNNGYEESLFIKSFKRFRMPIKRIAGESTVLGIMCGKKKIVDAENAVEASILEYNEKDGELIFVG